jgi:hypothetical protein
MRQFFPGASLKTETKSQESLREVSALEGRSMSQKKVLGVVRTSDGKRYILQTWDFVLHLMDESVYREFLENSETVGQEVAFRNIYDKNRVRTLGYPTDSPGFYGKVDPNYKLE